MRYFIICAIVAFVLCGCEAEKESNDLRVEVTSVRFITWPTDGQQWRDTLPGEAYTDYVVEARIYGNGAVQEVAYTADQTSRRRAVDFTFVEYFGIKSQGWTYATDTHQGRVNSVATMVCYDGSVSGCDFLNGYAMLSGSDEALYAQPGDQYDYRANPYYLDSHNVQGQATSVGKGRVEWTIVADATGLTITTGSSVAHYAAP